MTLTADSRRTSDAEIEDEAAFPEPRRAGHGESWVERLGWEEVD